MYKLGIDVGGTNTDAVLIDENLKVVASVKRHTTSDVYDGILNAIRAVLEQSGVDRSEISQAMLGTTQCTNAIVERKHLAPIGVLRLGAPATVGIPPMVDWAEDLKKIAVKTAVIGGGFEYDGKELAPLDEAAARVKLQGIRRKDPDADAERNLSRQLDEAIRDNRFEKAAELRDRLQSLVQKQLGALGRGRKVTAQDLAEIIS